MGKIEITKQIADYFESGNIPYTWDEKSPCVAIKCDVGSILGYIPEYIIIREDASIVMAVCPIRAHSNSTFPVAEYLSRLNEALEGINARFWMNLETGDIYCCSMCEGSNGILDIEEVAECILLPLAVLHYSGKTLIDIMEECGAIGG